MYERNPITDTSITHTPQSSVGGESCAAGRWLAFGGGSLCEGKTVRLVYMDEAGISQHEPFTVVSAVIVHGDSALNAVENHLDRLVERHIPSHQREGFIFQAKHLFGGVPGAEKPFGRDNPEWTLERRLGIARDLAAIPAKFKLPVAYGWVKKADFPSTFELPVGTPIKELLTAGHVCSFMSCAMMVEHWMRYNARDENCLLVVENNDQAKKMINDVQVYHQNRQIGAMLDDEARKHFPLKKIKETPLFQDKRPRSALQVADFCAYVFKRFLMNDKRYSSYVEAMWPLVVGHEGALDPRLDGKPYRTPPGPPKRRSRGRSR